MANIFPKWSNDVPKQALIALVLVVVTVTAAVTYYFTPKYTRVGYMPKQPVPYSHALHVDQLGLDCRYCHSYVDQSGHANIPDAATCMNCHSQVKKDSPLLAPVRESYKSGNPVPWVWIHKTPDYVYFNHAVHVNRGVSCVECHGRVDQMEVVWHDQPFSMSWCLDCHRNPEQKIRPLKEVYNLGWAPQDPHAHLDWATKEAINWNINPPQSCSGCHR